MQVSAESSSATCLSPKVRISAWSIVGSSDELGQRTSFAAVARVVEVLAGGPIREVVPVVVEFR